MNFRAISVFLLCVISLASQGQTSFVMSNNREYYHLLDRYEIMQGQLSNRFHTSAKPIGRDRIELFAHGILNQGLKLSRRDSFNLNYLIADNPEWSLWADTLPVSIIRNKKPLLHYFYQYKAAFLSVGGGYGFRAIINPVFYFNGGVESHAGLAGRQIWQSTRGAEMRGIIGDRVGFYTYLTDNQVKAPVYQAQRFFETGVYPGAGLTKPYKNDSNTYDFFEARGYITFDLLYKTIGVQFGHDRNFIGNGYRSLVLSDFSKENLFLKITTNVWKLNYTNLFMELEPFAPSQARRDNRKKYMAFHHLSMNITKKLNVGLFESIVFSRGDSITGGGRFDANYYNPIIFYRSIEHNIQNSSDNAMAGFDVKYNPTRSLSFYAQFILDDFHIGDLRKRNGAVVNKYGIQAGLKYINVLKVKNLDLQMELNSVRPYTFQHFNSAQTYTNFNTPLGHPMGANFNELLAIIRYQPVNRIGLTAKAIYSKFGTDSAGINYGGDITKNYYTAPNLYGNTIGQGVGNTLLYGEFTLSYMPYHNLFFDARYIYRKQSSDITANSSTANIFMLSMRLNFGLRSFEF